MPALCRSFAPSTSIYRYTSQYGHRPSGTFTATANLNAPRASATATVLNSGQVLISGGSNCATPGCPVSAAELYDPIAGTFTNTGSLNVARFSHTATLLTNGQVLVAGGYSSCAISCTSETTAELYDPTSGAFTSTQALSTARSGQTATLISSGEVVITGGVSGGSTLASIDFYQPSSLTPSGLTSIAVAPANASVPEESAQQFVAIGTFSNNTAQTLRSVVWNSADQSVTGITNDAGSSGFVYPVSGSSTTITATAGAVSGSTFLNAGASLTSIAVTPSSPRVVVGQAQQLSATGNYSDGSTKDLTATATWTSSNTQVATVSSTSPGLATGTASGSASIRAQVGGLNASASLTVDPGTPTISSLSATAAPIGTMIAISGSNFGAQTGSVTFNNVTASVTSWTDNVIITQVPSGATTGPLQVGAGPISSNTITFTVVAQASPVITMLSALVGVVGDPITITGSGFGTSGTVSFNSVTASGSSWSNTAIVTQIPVGAQTGSVTVNSSGLTSNGVTLTIVAAPTVATITPTSGDVGTVVTISGNNFASLQSGPMVFFNGAAVMPTSWTNNQIAVTVPKGTSTGPLIVKVGYASSNATTFTIEPTGSQVLSITPANSTLYVGQTLNLSLNDDLEHNITGATWTLSDATLAQLSSNNPPVLTAQKVGTETVTATWNGLTASAQVTIVAGGVALPLGTVVCSLPTTTSSYTVKRIMQMVPSNGSTPNLVAVEDDGAGSIWLRGLSSGCEQQWHTRVGSTDGPDTVLGL